METALAPFLGTWTVMMAAMMLPSAWPMVRMHRLTAEGIGRLGTELRTAVFVAGYLLVWASFGLAVWLAGMLVELVVPADVRPFGIAAILFIAGAYQFTRLKIACLRACRTPMDFLLTHWYAGTTGALRLGIEHGLYCLGCCWALMAVFVVAGAMGLVWAVCIASVVFVEKVFPHGVGFARVTGLALIAGAVVVAIRSGLAALPGGQ